MRCYWRSRMWSPALVVERQWAGSGLKAAGVTSDFISLHQFSSVDRVTRTTSNPCCLHLGPRVVPSPGLFGVLKADLEWPLQGHFNFLKCGLKEQVYPEKEIVWLEIDLTIGMDHQLFVPDNFSAYCRPKHILEGKYEDLWRRIPHVYEKNREGEGEKIFFQEAGVSGNNLGAWEREWEWLIPLSKFGDGFGKIHSPSSYHCHSQHQQQNDLIHHQEYLCS